MQVHVCPGSLHKTKRHHCISGLVAEYIVAIDVTRVRFSADAYARGFPFCSQRVNVRCRSMDCLLHVCPERDALLFGGFVPRPGRMTLAA